MADIGADDAKNTVGLAQNARNQRPVVHGGFCRSFLHVVQ
jgi:hypothetical protein